MTCNLSYHSGTAVNEEKKHSKEGRRASARKSYDVGKRKETWRGGIPLTAPRERASRAKLMGSGNFAG